MKQGKIHIVDEGQSYIRLLDLLEGDEYEVTVSNVISYAFQNILLQKPDMVIIDIHIEDKLGIELCKEIKQHSLTADIKVIFMAVSGFPYLIAQAYKAGARDFLTKPFSPIETVLRVRGLMELISARKKVAEAREKEKLALQEAEEASTIKSQFLAVMSHEIRTPLNAIIGFSGLLADESLSKDQLEMINTVKSSSDILLGIVNDILDITKIESGQVDLENAPFYLDDVVFEAAGISRSRITSDELQILVDMNVKDKCLIGDSLKLKQVLTNLISNAVKFTSKGVIHIGVREENGKIAFSISDTGIGMNDEQVKIIFKPFRQADSSMTRRFGGTGLGLSISNSYVEAMGGKISVESEPGIGSCFSFELMFEKEVDFTKRNLVNTYRGKVLVVDGNHDFLKIMSRDLKSTGFEVHTYTHWCEIPETSETFDIAFIDSMNEQHMQSSFIDRIRKRYAIQKCILVTPRISTESNKSAMTIGYDEAICKPFRIKDIKTSLQPFRKKHDKTTTIDFKGSHTDGKSLSVLVVDDNKSNQMVASRILKDLGHQVSLAENGKVAVDMVQGGSFDVVFMDLHMPVTNGFTATRIIRSLESGKDLPIIAMTANALVTDRQDCLDWGMNDFIAKPITKHIIWSVLERIDKIQSEQKALFNLKEMALIEFKN